MPCRRDLHWIQSGKPEALDCTFEYFWFAEHNTTEKFAVNVPSILSGGIGLCTTRDYKHWRNEGIMVNLFCIKATL